jgi:hypothetical protein
VVYHRPRELRENVYSVSAGAPPRASATALLQPTFLYLWAPGLAAPQ